MFRLKYLWRRCHPPGPAGSHTPGHKLFTLLDLCVPSLRRGHANILGIVPMLAFQLYRSFCIRLDMHAQMAGGTQNMCLMFMCCYGCTCLGGIQNMPDKRPGRPGEAFLQSANPDWREVAAAREGERTERLCRQANNSVAQGLMVQMCVNANGSKVSSCLC